MIWYYKLLANRPHFVVIIVAVFSIACIVVSLTFPRLPNFSDPTLGFESRGTSIGQRLTAWQNILEATSRRSRTLFANPDEIMPHNLEKKPKTKNKHRHGKGKERYHKIKIIKDSLGIANLTQLKIDQDYEDSQGIGGNFSGNHHEEWNYGKNLSSTSEFDFNKRKETNEKQWKLLRNPNPPSVTVDMHIKTDGFFCEATNSQYSHFVVQRINYNLTTSLFEINALLAMCDLEFKMQQTPLYDTFCETEMTSENSCCRPWSLPNYVALLSNRSSCFELEPVDLDLTRTLLLECFEYYHNFKLSNECVISKCEVPPECAQHNAVYNILHFLVDTEFIQTNETTFFLTSAMVFFPIAKSSNTLPLYYNFEKTSMSNQLVSVVAMDMGLKNALFDDCLLLDGWLIGLGGLFVMTCMWLYTKSFFITIMTFIAIVFSLGIAYFVYTLLFELPFFPFMNLLAVVVIIGIGADDAFIFVKVWNCAIAERVKTLGGGGGVNNGVSGGVNGTAGGGCEKGSSGNNGGLAGGSSADPSRNGRNFPPLTTTSSMASDVSYKDTLDGLMADALKHSALSMGVTSLTTAVAFYSSYINSITAIKCFGIFAGTAVISNYILMITWLPASVSLVERINCMSPQYFKQTANTLFNSINQISGYIEEFIISAVVHLPKLWIVLLGSIGIFSSVILFYWPKLRLPDSPNFKLFDSEHPFERYDSEFRNQFWFEKLYTNTETFKLPIRFVWGVKPIDNGNYLDPLSRGDLFFDDTFNISNTESQVWLLNFCQDIKRQPFYQVVSSGHAVLPTCFIENFIHTMDRRCFDNMSQMDRTPCCEIYKFPYPPHIFEKCLPRTISMLYESPRYIFIPGIAGPKFQRQLPTGNKSIDTKNYPPPITRVLVVEYESNQPYTMAYDELDQFQHQVQNWFDKQMLTAPPEMQNAWFISDLGFFDLQHTLSQDTIYAIITAMGVSLLVLLLMTLNILISLYAIITVTLTIFTTVAILVLMNWKLNVLESISVSTAIGLTIDFSLHYGNYYRICPEMEREPSTRYALSRMLGPTAMAAITTGAAGAFMLPSRVLPYIQIGTFLVIVMAISWIFATFFLMSLLCAFGPQYGFGQFSLSKFRRPRGEPKVNGINHVDYTNRSSTQGTASEQLLSASSSAAGEMIASESHELSSLNSNSIVKPPSSLETRPINFDRAFVKATVSRQQSITYLKDSSPTSTSAITEVLPDECDIDDSMEY